MDRRTVITTGGSLLTAAIAGCSGSEQTERETGGTGDRNNTGGSRESSDTNGGNNANGGSGESTTTGENSGPGDTKEERVKLVEHKWYQNGQFDSGVTGQLKNVSGQTLSYVEVTIYFIDKEGVQFSESLDNTSELAADRVWEFDAMFTGEDPSRVDTYEIETSVSNY